MIQSRKDRLGYQSRYAQLKTLDNSQDKVLWQYKKYS